MKDPLDVGPIRFVGVDESGRHVARAIAGTTGPVVAWQILTPANRVGRGFFVTIPIPPATAMYARYIEQGLLSLQYVIDNNLSVL